jgi:inorganic phosphate transporter, PiT family
MAMDTMVIVLILLMFALAFGIGANDETMATLVGSRIMKLKTAIIIAAVLVFLGVVFLSASVGKTVGASLLGSEVQFNTFMMLAIIISTTIWLVVASKTGAPISTTHSVVGSVFGIAIVWAIQTQNSFIDALNWDKMGNVVIGWVISPILGFGAAYLTQILVNKFIKKRAKGLDSLEDTEKGFMILFVAAVFWTQFSRGGNDSANALGIMYGLIETGDVDASMTYPLLIIAGLVLAAGLVIIGKNVIENVGNNLIEMRPSDAFSIQLSTSVIIFLATILGLPISGSHILIFAVIGAGRVKGEKPDKKSFRKMVISWIVTFPIAAGLSAILYVIFAGVFPV